MHYVETYERNKKHQIMTHRCSFLFSLWTFFSKEKQNLRGGEFLKSQKRDPGFLVSVKNLPNSSKLWSRDYKNYKNSPTQSWDFNAELFTLKNQHKIGWLHRCVSWRAKARVWVCTGVCMSVQRTREILQPSFLSMFPGSVVFQVQTASFLYGAKSRNWATQTLHSFNRNAHSFLRISNTELFWAISNAIRNLLRQSDLSETLCESRNEGPKTSRNDSGESVVAFLTHRLRLNSLILQMSTFRLF